MKDPETRLTELEFVVTHLQRTIHDLNEVIIDQGKRIDTLQRETRLIASDIRQVRESSREPRRAEDEIPPHY
jgi:uncharacterized coiled-coil protein SlyX